MRLLATSSTPKRDTRVTAVTQTSERLTSCQGFHKLSHPILTGSPSVPDISEVDRVDTLIAFITDCRDQLTMKGRR